MKIGQTPPKTKYCKYCGQELIGKDKTVDHFWPRKVRNKRKLQGPKYPCCRICNLIKNDFSFQSIEAVREFIETKCKHIVSGIKAIRLEQANKHKRPDPETLLREGENQ